MDFIVKSESNLVSEIFKKLESKIKPGFLVALIGDLGAGKTTLVKGIAEKLKVEETVTSPTFNLRKEYSIKPGLKLQHIDLYRTEKNSDIREVLDWLSDKQSVTFVEWPEKLFDDLSMFDLVIKIDFINPNQRKVKIKWN